MNDMKIKLHNSLAKINKKHSLFLFDEKLLVRTSGSYYLFLTYNMDDKSYSLYFYPETKKFEEFRKNEKKSNPEWWKIYEWKEMS